LGDGPPGFPQGSTCPVVLGNRTQEVAAVFAYWALTVCGRPFQANSANGAIGNFPADPQIRPVRPHDPRAATAGAFGTTRV